LRPLEGHLAARIGLAGDLDRPGHQIGALAHAFEAAAGRVDDGFGCEAAAVVLDIQQQGPVGQPEVDGHPTGAGVAADVGQGLLQDPVGAQGHLGRDPIGFARQAEVEVDLDVRLALELLDQLAHRGL